MNLRISALRRLQPFAWGFTLLSCLLFRFAALPVHAQSDGVSAGGSWTQYEYEDKMTAARNVRFELISNAGQHDLYSQSRVEILCENGHWKGSNFTPGGRLGPPTHPGFWGQPKMEVMVRVDNRHHNQGWNWNGKFLAMDKGTTRELIGARIFNVEFLGPSSPQIAEFSPGGIDLIRVSKACGLVPKKH